MTKTAKEILEQVYLFGMNGGLGYEKFDNELSPDQALKELEALIRTEKLKLLAEIGEPKLGDVVLMQPEQYAGGVTIDEWYKNRINKLEAEL